MRRPYVLHEFWLERDEVLVARRWTKLNEIPKWFSC